MSGSGENAGKGDLKRTTAIKWSLFRNLILLIIFIAIAILISIRVIGIKSVHALSEINIYKTSALSMSAIEKLFAPVRKVLTVSQQLGEKEVFNPQNTTSMNRVFIPMLNAVTQVTSLNTGDKNGNGYLLLKLADSWKNRIVTAKTVGLTTNWLEFDSSGEQQLTAYQKAIKYDPRLRLWYKAAVENNNPNMVAWTAPYTFFTTKEPGITAAIVVNPHTAPPYILAMDILLKDISDYTIKQKPSPNGFVAVLTKDGKIIGFPHHPAVTILADRNKLLLEPVEKSGILPLIRAFEIWCGEHEMTDKTFVVDIDGEKWWASLKLYYLNKTDCFFVAVMVPEDDLVQGLWFQQLLTIAITCLALVIAGIMAIILARKYSFPLEMLVRQTEAISELNFDKLKSVESNIREVHYLAKAHDKMKTTLDSFTRYIPIDVVRTLMKRGDAAKVGGSRKYVTTFFSDISEFTAISENMQPEQLTAHMTDYFDMILAVLDRHHATIDKLIGDAVVAFWNAPQDLDNHEAHALAAVIDCVEHLKQANIKWKQQGLPELHTRFGLHAGEVIVGNMGSSIRLNYTMLGDTVNLGSRLEGLNKYYGTCVLVSETVMGKNPEYEFRKIDIVAVKGKTKPVTIYEPLGRKGVVSKALLELRDSYESALIAYHERDFNAGLITVEKMLVSTPDDLALLFLQHRIKACLDIPPQPEWSGTEYFYNK
jgi:adenylate cyclase